MKIEKNLNLVIPVETGSGILQVHSTPISRAVFERYYMTLGQTFTRIFSGGLGRTAGPGVAFFLLRDLSKAYGDWDGPDGVENGLVNEMRRLTTVIAPRAQGGWEQIPYGQAVSAGLIDQDDAGEIDNALVFFTVVSSVPPKSQRADWIGGLKIWGASATSLTATEFAAGLTTSTGAESTGAKPLIGIGAVAAMNASSARS